MTASRVLFVIESLGVGGAEQSLVNIAPALQARGYRCGVVALWPPYTLAEALEQRGIDVFRLDLGHRWNLMQSIPRLLRVVREHRYDILHGHLFFGGMHVAATRPFLPSVRRAVTFHNLGYASYPVSSLWRRTRRVLDRLAMTYGINAHIAVSTPVADHYRDELGLPNIAVIPNGFVIETLKHDRDALRRKFFGHLRLPSTTLLALTAGRLIEEKDHRNLIEAVDLLKQRGRDIVVTIVGAGPLRKKIEEEIRRRGLEDRIHMQPVIPHDELMEMMQAVDLFLLPSTFEGFPLVPAEAMIAERAVVATRAGGVVELIEDGVSGMLVPTRDPHAFAGAMEKVMLDPALRQRLGAAARERVRQFSADRIADRLASLYTEMTRSASAHVPQAAQESL
jgi:glycosyltransferase involved in cell wall biosynthesis